MRIRSICRLPVAYRGDVQGQAIVLVALAMMAMIGVMGLAIDAGLIMSARRNLVSVTDAAALAAAGALSGTPSESDATRQSRATARAREYALFNGFDPDVAGHTMSVSFPSSSPPRKLVQVESTRAVKLAFMKLFGVDTVTVSSGARTGEAAPVDVALVMDVSASQCEQTSNADTGGSGWCSMLRNPSNPTQFWSVPWPYWADQPTRTNWPPSSTPTRTNHPWKPFADQQYAARYFIDQLDPRYDQVAVVSFSSTVPSGASPYGTYNSEARVHQNLTNDFAAAKNVIGLSSLVEGQSGQLGLFPAGQTNIAKGIEVALNVLTTIPPARADAVTAMILLSDGSPTRRLNGTTPSGCSSSNPGNCTNPRSDTMAQTQVAKDKRIVIYTIFCGSAAFATNHALMLQWIADLTDNRRLDGVYTGSRDLPSGYGPAYDAAWFRDNVSDNYYLASDYAQLQEAYDSIFRKIYTRLVH